MMNFSWNVSSWTHPNLAKVSFRDLNFIPSSTGTFRRRITFLKEHLVRSQACLPKREKKYRVLRAKSYYSSNKQERLTIQSEQSLYFRPSAAVKRANMVPKRLLNIPILLVLCPMLCGAGTALQCSQAESFIYGMMLRRHIMTKITGISLSGLCLLECYRDVRCQSYNYLISRATCELNNRTKEARPEDFVPDSGRYYFTRDRNRGKFV